MKSADENQIVWDLLEWGNLEALKILGRYGKTWSYGRCYQIGNLQVISTGDFYGIMHSINGDNGVWLVQITGISRAIHFGFMIFPESLERSPSASD